MTDYGLTTWEYSDEQVEEKKELTPGVKNLFIKDAKMNPEDNIYILTLQDLDEGVEFTVRYWMETVDKDTNNFVPNRSAIGTIHSLGQALFKDSDKPVGRPAPGNVVGGVVTADVQLKESTNGKKYPRIWKFEPAPKWIVEQFSKIKQYAVDD